MTEIAQLHGEPRWWLTRWLAGTGQSVPDDVRASLQAMLFGNLPIFLGGAASTTGIAVLVALFFPSPPSSPGAPSRSPSTSPASR